MIDNKNIEEIKKLVNLIKESNNIVFFGGAGVSVASGIPDFRSGNGLYSNKYKGIFLPEEILSHTFFKKNPEDFYDFYKSKMIFLKAKPNNCHNALAYLEKVGKLKAVITQNIDGLHQMAGSLNVLELHGTIYDNYCINCLQDYDINKVINSDGVPKCSCGGIIKPKVVLYEEALDDDVIYKSIDYIRNADLFIIGGTSLSVYPASGLVRHYEGNKLVIINKNVLEYDKYADLVINDDIDYVFNEVLKQIGEEGDS